MGTFLPFQLLILKRIKLSCKLTLLSFNLVLIFSGFCWCMDVRRRRESWNESNFERMLAFQLCKFTFNFFSYDVSFAFLFSIVFDHVNTVKDKVELNIGCAHSRNVPKVDKARLWNACVPCCNQRVYQGVHYLPNHRQRWEMYQQTENEHLIKQLYSKNGERITI